MWKIFFTYRDKSKCTVTGKGIITPELAVKCFYRYGLHATESIYQQYPKKDHEPVPLEEKIRELGVDATEMKTAVLQAETLLDRMKGEGEMLNIIQNDFETANTTYLDEDKVNLVVESVIETIKKGLPEEAQTVEALEFITDRIKERVKEKRVEL